MGGDGGTKAIQRKFMRGYVNPNDEIDKKNIKGFTYIEFCY